MSQTVTPSSLKAQREIEQAARAMLAKEAQAYHDLTVQGDPERSFFAYLYCDKKPNVKFVLAFADIICRLGAAWSPALRGVYFRMARMGRLLISTFHKPPGAHILPGDDDESTDYYTYDMPTLKNWQSRQRAQQVGREIDGMESDEEFDGEEFEEIG